MTRFVALLLTAMTGFSGLVYEVVWQKYLATLLGSHSEATAAVLAIFLGGLAVGYRLFGFATRRLVTNAQEAGQPPRLLFVYGLLEFSIGVYVVLFPWLFELVQALSFAIPHGASGVGFAIDVFLTVLLIGPASVMMGGTIPILTQALAKSLDDATRFHAFVYAFNTAGAFVGALAAGFYLVPLLGLVNVLLVMGSINLFAGSVFMLIGRRGGQVVSLNNVGEDNAAIDAGDFRIYHAVALLTGFAMMALQTTAIRVGGLSFGSSQFTFSMVVAVFVLCIALGSFGVSSLASISRRAVVANQWLLAGLFAFLYFQVEKSPYWVHVLRSIFRDVDASFAPYYAGAFLGVLALIGLPIILSGAVLPLLFHLMRSEADHLGDTAGRLYGWNTIGSLLGALLGGYVLFFWFDLHHVYRFAVAALVLAAVLLSVRALNWSSPLAAATLVPALIALFVFPEWDHRVLQSGLFRSRDALPSAGEGLDAFIEANPRKFGYESLFHTDDPIASVRAYATDVGPGLRSVSIVVNGKSDGNTHGDFETMSLASTLPAILAEKVERGLVIGWGTGVTAGQLAKFDTIQQVDVAEISPGVVDAAPHFDFANFNASTSPKIQVIRSDAYRALMRSDGTYDVIVSEPSNPWVTGIEMLYSAEFLEVAKAKLSPGGVYCQWFHEYETDTAVLEIVLRTYASVFDHVAVWRTKAPDLLIIGMNDPANALDVVRMEQRASRPDFKAALESLGVQTFPELLAHELLPMGVVHALELEGPIHTLYHPILSDAAGRAFFRGSLATFPFSGYEVPAKVGADNSLLRRYAAKFGGQLPEETRERVVIETCRVHGLVCHALLAEWKHDDPDSPGFKRTAGKVERFLDARAQIYGEEVRLEPPPKDLNVLAALYRPASESAERDRASYIYVATAERATNEYENYYFHHAPFEPDALHSIWQRCGESRPSRQACEATVAQRARAGPVANPNPQAQIEQCMRSLVPGPSCRAGQQSALELTRAPRDPAP